MVLLAGASLNKPHTSGKFGTVITYVITTRKSEQYPYLVGTVITYTNNYEKKQMIVWYGRSGTENNKLSLLILHIWLIWSFSHGE